MKLYMWKAMAFRGTSYDRIVAIGETVEEARAAAREQFAPIVKSEREWLFPDGFYEPDVDDIAEREAYIAALEAAIMGEPEIAEAVIFPGKQ